MSNSAGGDHRSVRAQLKDAAKELWLVLAPAVAFGTLGGVVSVVVGSLLFEEPWVTAFLGVVVMTVTVGYIVHERVNTLAAKPPGEAADYE